jgi:hypothetical protein
MTEVNEVLLRGRLFFERGLASRGNELLRKECRQHGSNMPKVKSSANQEPKHTLQFCLTSSAFENLSAAIKGW